MPRAKAKASKSPRRAISQPAEAKVFMSGRSQAVRLPLEFRVSGRSVFIKRLGNAIVLLPKSKDPLAEVFAALDAFPRGLKFTRNQRQSVRPGLAGLFENRKK